MLEWIVFGVTSVTGMGVCDMNIKELHETAEALRTTTPEDTDEMALICAEIHDARDLEDAITRDERAACAELESQLAKLREPYRLQKAAINAVVEAATGALVRRLTLDEQAAEDAVRRKYSVPAPRDMPKGMRVTRKTILSAVDMAKLPETFWSVVADQAAILRAAEKGLEVPGATIDIKLGVVYTRGKK